MYPRQALVLCLLESSLELSVGVCLKPRQELDDGDFCPQSLDEVLLARGARLLLVDAGSRRFCSVHGSRFLANVILLITIIMK